MPPNATNPASTEVHTGSGDTVCFGGEHLLGSRKFPEKQAKNYHILRLRRQRLVERLHRLGPAPLFHLLTDLDAGNPLWPTVEKYAALPADFIKALGGD